MLKKIELENSELKKNALSKVHTLIDMFTEVLNESCVLNQKKTEISCESKKNITKRDLFIANGSDNHFQNADNDIRFSMDLEFLKKDCQRCKRCRLCETRTNPVFGDGYEERPDVFVVGEGPGETEDKTGIPFSGKSGELLEKMLKAISLSRKYNCYISNVVKCRAPGNRDPLEDEQNACGIYLKQQIALLQPKAILCLGKISSSFLIENSDVSIKEIHGKIFFYDKSIPLICTYHPSAVLRNQDLKRPVWEDLKKLANFLNII